MFNRDFLKTLTILYVEDEDLAREKLSQILTRFFKKVIVAPNGEEGYKTFQKIMLSENIDLILSDINMPKMNGIEMLEKIREVNAEVPIVYTTARTESEYLLKAIELNASHYIIKPIDIEDTLNRIQKVCEKKYFQKVIKQKKLELEQYSSILDNVAAVFKLDSEKNLTFINTLLLETLKEDEEKVLGKKITSFFHRDVSTSFVDNIWETVKKGISWQDNIKFLDSKNEIFYLNTTVFQIISDDGLEYVGIGFISTHEVKERREFHKKVIENIKNSNIKNHETNKQLEEHNSIVNKLKSIATELTEQLKIQKEKVASHKGQIKFYEKEIADIDNKLEKKLSMKNKEIIDLKELIESLRSEKALSLENIKKIENELVSAHSEIDSKENLIKRKNERISTLEDLLAHRESQLRKINPELIM